MVNFGYWFNKNLRADWENQLQNYQSSSQLFSTKITLLNLRNQTKIGLQTFGKHTNRSFYRLQNQGQKRRRRILKNLRLTELYNGKTENFYPVEILVSSIMISQEMLSAL